MSEATHREGLREWLASHINLETGVGAPPGQDGSGGAPTLERMRRLLGLLGSPEEDFPAIHVAGTTGKTTTARMVTDLLRNAGLSVGTYTSPDLGMVEERIAYDGASIDATELDGALEIIRAVEDDMIEVPSYFEIVTAAAFREFADLAVDVAVIEVGLGGEWDATNLARSEIVCITNVSIDHTEYFGDTLDEIAVAEAAVVEPDAPLALGVTDPDLVPCFTDRGAHPVLRRGVHFDARDVQLAIGGRVATLSTPRETYDDVFIGLHGAHQADNAAIALVTAEAFFGAALPDALVRKSFEEVRSPGRLEALRHQPLVLLDGAHNVAGCAALRRALSDEFAAGPRAWVIGLLREKDPFEMLDALGIRESDAVVACRPPTPRALDPELVAAAAKELPEPPRTVEVVDDVVAALDRALDGAPDDAQVVVTGSLYVVGAARMRLVDRS